jgi:hypothetical protein
MVTAPASETEFLDLVSGTFWHGTTIMAQKLALAQ